MKKKYAFDYDDGKATVTFEVENLLIECQSRNLHCSITYQRMNDFSIEIYRGYKTRYEKFFFTDGHIEVKKAVKEAMKFLKDFDKKE